MIFNYIPSYPTPQIYYQITHNCVNLHHLSDHLLSNNLILNSSKSELQNIVSNYHYCPPVIIDSLPITPSSSVINLGVTLDANLFLNSHIANIYKSANYHLFKIHGIRKDLTRPLTTVIINALILSRIDYCSSLLYHLPNTSLSPLNRIIRASI